jgi:hypothetical protein
MIGASSYATKDEAKAGKKAAQNAGVCVKVKNKPKESQSSRFGSGDWRVLALAAVAFLLLIVLPLGFWWQMKTERRS